jgi:hypothetical protein
LEDGQIFVLSNIRIAMTERLESGDWMADREPEAEKEEYVYVKIGW